MMNQIDGIEQILDEDLLPQLIVRHATASPDRVFMKQVEGGSQTYAQTHARARAWSQLMRGLGVEPGHKVARFTPTCMESVNIWVGLGWLGATDVPINTEFRGAMLAAILQSARAEILVCDARWLEAVHAVADQLDYLTTVVVIGGPFEVPTDCRLRHLDGADLLASATAEESFEYSGPQPHDVAMVVYTSGTVGVSKAVVLPWATYAAGARQFCPPGDALTSEDVLYLPYPLFHIAGTFWTHAIARVGATVVLRETFSTSSFWRDIGEYGCTVTHLLGATANYIYRQPTRPVDADNTLRMVSMIPLLKDLRGFERRFDVQAYSVYGMTEVGVVTRTSLSPEDPSSCGVPFPGYALRVVNEFDQEVPDGEIGELVVRPLSPWTTFTEYFGMPEATVAAWRNLWFHTGDGFRRDQQGNYHFVDRIKDSIRRRGENISSMEVEMYVVRHEAVLECAAIPVPSEWSEDEVKVCVVVKEGHELTEVELVEFLIAEAMPRFMLPRYVQIMQEFPKTPTGKIQKNILRKNSDLSADWDREREQPKSRLGTYVGRSR
ncbi:hypothetical protein EEB14_50565 [Rhodococcus sp. WS4]|nr:hypothetical protein EEB14_50565 [Rhodococcus sp. WS4]